MVNLCAGLTGGKVNPLIGSAGVSAVPMAARVSQKVGAEADPTNFLLMHAMGPNVAGVIGTAVAAGTFMAIFGVGALIMNNTVYRVTFENEICRSKWSLIRLRMQAHVRLYLRTVVS